MSLRVRLAAQRGFGSDGDRAAGSILAVMTPSQFEKMNGTGASGDGEQAAFGRIGQAGGSRAADVERAGEGDAAERVQWRVLEDLDDRVTMPGADHVIGRGIVPDARPGSPSGGLVGAGIAIASDGEATGIMIQSESGECET